MILQIALAAGVSAFIFILLVLVWGTRFGSAAKERAMKMPGDDWLGGGPAARVAMTRAITIEAFPDKVWPWLEQMGRGAGCSGSGIGSSAAVPERPIQRSRKPAPEINTSSTR